MNAFELLTATDYQRAGELAQLLDSQNSQRQAETHEIREQAAARVLEQDPDALLFFAADPAFSPGVVGLAASRLSESFYRPAIVAHQGKEFTVGSCRSIPEFHITRALDECASLLVRHGGHAAAAGFTVRNELVPVLVEQLMAIAARELAEVPLEPVIDIDREIKLEKLNAGTSPASSTICTCWSRPGAATPSRCSPRIMWRCATPGWWGWRASTSS
jgi:single-stranded-DNA-specific exonuclease